MLLSDSPIQILEEQISRLNSDIYWHEQYNIGDGPPFYTSTELKNRIAIHKEKLEEFKEAIEVLKKHSMQATIKAAHDCE